MTMKQYLFPTIFFVFSLISSSVFAELPRSFSASYALHYDDLRIGVMERRFTRNNDGSGMFESKGKLTGLAALFRKDQISESSRFEIKAGQLRPIQYQYSKTGGKKEKVEKHRFDWENNKVSSTTNDGNKESDITRGLLDKLLYQLAIMEVEEPKAGLEFNIIDGTTLKTYQFAYKGEEELKTPMGTFQTLKFERVRSKESDSNNPNKRSTILWSAPSLHNLPIRVDNVDKKGHLTSIVVKKVSGLK